MALIKCPECGQMISEYAEKCISCGCPMEVIKGMLLPKHIDFKIKDNSLITKLNEEEKGFVLSVIDFAHENYKIAQYAQFISFVSKNDSHRSFWIVRPSDGLRYGYKDENDKTHKFKIKSTNPRWVIEENTIKVNTSKTNTAPTVEQNNVTGSFSAGEKRFILQLIEKANNRFPGEFKIENKINSCALVSLFVQGGSCLFVKEGQRFMFGYRKNKEEERKFITIGEADEASSALILQKIKYVFVNNQVASDIKRIEDNEPVKKKGEEDNIYSFIRREMTGAKYDATPSIRALCRSVKKYLLDVLNAESKSNNRINDTVFMSSVISFYGNELSWNKADGIRSAKIVYNYFKANTILEKIKDYEDIFKKQIITDNVKFLKFLYEDISKGLKVEYSRSDSLTPDFALVPESVLDDILINFKAYETD